MSKSSAITPASRSNPGGGAGSASTTPSASASAPAHPVGLKRADRSARLVCDMAPSPRLRLLLALILLQSALLLFVSRLPWIAVCVLLPVIAAYGWLEWRRLAASVGRLTTAERRWYWQVQGGARREFQLVGELTLWRWLVVINGRDLQGRRLRLVFARDAASADDWRRLLVALRYSR